MIRLDIRLFGFLRSYDANARLALELPGDARIADLRAALIRHGLAHWPGFSADALHSCAFASERAVLRDSDALPADGQVAVLPPVSGG